MPYNSLEDRVHIAKGLQNIDDNVGPSRFHDIAEIIRTVPSGKIKGAVNYFVTRIALLSLISDGGLTYSGLSDTIGVLRDAADEIQRRLLGPYEDKAIQKNGDIEELMMEP